MHKILSRVNQEIEQIEHTGLHGGNIEFLSKLIDIRKDIDTIKAMEGEEPMRYREDDYRYGSDYGYRNGNGRYNDYRRNGYPRGNSRLSEHLNRIMDGADAYEYGRERYREGGGSERMEEGLDKVMYGVCVFVESMIDFAETPQEKEIIRKHIQKMKSV